LAAALSAVAEPLGATGTLARWNGWLLNLDDAAHKVYEELTPHAGRKPVDDAVRYLETHGHQMDYGAARPAGRRATADGIRVFGWPMPRWLRAVTRGVTWRPRDPNAEGRPSNDVRAGRIDAARMLRSR
jgi:hypothetical protein